MSYTEEEFCRVFPCISHKDIICDDCKETCNFRKDRKKEYLIFLVGFEFGRISGNEIAKNKQ